MLVLAFLPVKSVAKGHLELKINVALRTSVFEKDIKKPEKD